MSPKEQSQRAAELFKDRLRAARKRADFTQDELVAKADISAVTLSKLETGVNRPSFEIFVSLAYALGVSPEVLIGWDFQALPDSDANRHRLLMRLNAAVQNLSDEWIEQLISLAEQAATKADR